MTDSLIKVYFGRAAMMMQLHFQSLYMKRYVTGPMRLCSRNYHKMVMMQTCFSGTGELKQTLQYL